jgi:hypothetical protein
MVPAKLQYAPDDSGYSFTVEGVTPGAIETVKIKWGDVSISGSANQVLAERHEDGPAIRACKSS